MAAWIEQTYGKLDILVNNAGVNGDTSAREQGTPTLPSWVTFEDLREVFETNVFGVFAATCVMLPLLRRSEAGRIVNLSSEMGSMSLRSDLRPQRLRSTHPPWPTMPPRPRSIPGPSPLPVSCEIPLSRSMRSAQGTSQRT